MKPSFKLERDQERILKFDKGGSGFFKDNVCPNGSVPIQQQKDGVIHPRTLNYPGEHFATLVTGDNQKTYRGGTAYISVEQPSVSPDQFTGGLIWLSNGPANEINTIVFGWMVNPKLYGDNLSRTTAFWTGNGCYNTLCPGFVQISRSSFLGMTYENVSTPKEQFECIYSIIQDPVTGNWWLTILFEKIGYYPKELFTHLNEGATNVVFGGLTYAPSGQSSPPMGRGTFAGYDSEHSSTFRRIQTVDANYRVADIDYKHTKEFIDNKKCYSLRHFEYNRKDRVAFSYGGPGGKYCGI